LCLIPCISRAAAAAARLVLALMQQPWFEPPVEPLHALVRQDLDSYPFRQLPRFVDEVNAKVDLVQSMVSSWEKDGNSTQCKCEESGARQCKLTPISNRLVNYYQ
jgi:hypothetical protein